MLTVPQWKSVKYVLAVVLRRQFPPPANWVVSSFKMLQFSLFSQAKPGLRSHFSWGGSFLSYMDKKLHGFCGHFGSDGFALRSNGTTYACRDPFKKPQSSCTTIFTFCLNRKLLKLYEGFYFSYRVNSNSPTSIKGLCNYIFQKLLRPKRKRFILINISPSIIVLPYVKVSHSIRPQR